MNNVRPSFWRRLPLIRWWLARAWSGPLIQAVSRREHAQARIALSRGASPNLLVEQGDRHIPVLTAAALHDDADMIDVLLEYGADLEAAGPNSSSHPALHTAVLGHHWKAARRLVDAGASWDTPIRVLDATTLVAAMSLGGVDPSKVQVIETTLEKLVSGEHASAADIMDPISNSPQAQGLLALHRARSAEGALEMSLPFASPPVVDSVSPSSRPRL